MEKLNGEKFKSDFEISENEKLMLNLWNIEDSIIKKEVFDGKIE